jgi:hypothetical protein
MNQDDLKEILNRCRLLAATADAFTKRRLLDLASKYETRLEGRTPPARTTYTDRQLGKESSD